MIQFMIKLTSLNMSLTPFATGELEIGELWLLSGAFSSLRFWSTFSKATGSFCTIGEALISRSKMRQKLLVKIVLEDGFGKKSISK